MPTTRWCLWNVLELTALQAILHAVGINGGAAAAGVVETGDLIELWRRLTTGGGVA